MMKTPEDVSAQVYKYIFGVLLRTGTTVFYNIISNIMRALGDSRTPSYFLIFSDNKCDIVFIILLKMDIEGTACMIELVVRIGSTVILVKVVGYTGVTLARPMAWIGLLLISVYYRVGVRNKIEK